jgi:hypothetical protein
MASPAAPVQPPTLNMQSRPPGRFVVSENLDHELKTLSLDATRLAWWSQLPPKVVVSTLVSRRASKRILVRLQAGLRAASKYAGRNAEHLTLAYLVEDAK